MKNRTVESKEQAGFSDFRQKTGAKRVLVAFWRLPKKYTIPCVFDDFCGCRLCFIQAKTGAVCNTRLGFGAPGPGGAGAISGDGRLQISRDGVFWVGGGSWRVVDLQGAGSGVVPHGVYACGNPWRAMPEPALCGTERGQGSGCCRVSWTCPEGTPLKPFAERRFRSGGPALPVRSVAPGRCASMKAVGVAELVGVAPIALMDAHGATRRGRDDCRSGTAVHRAWGRLAGSRAANGRPGMRLWVSPLPREAGGAFMN